MTAAQHFTPSLPPRFAVERELGRGGMGTVLLARDRTLGRPVAIKVLTPELARALGPERFTREIRLTAQLVHPNIVPLFDSGESDGWLFYVMPFIDGPTLRTRLGGAQPLTVAEVIRIVADTAEALAYAHGMGIVHRDVKPENIFAYGGRALLADFGIATGDGTAPGGNTLTATGTIIGTVSYMSPEQASGERDLDGRADLFSLGCVAYELLSGRPPFEGPSTIAMLAALMSDHVPSVRECRPDADPALATLIERLLAKDRDARPSDAAAVLDALRPLETQSGSQRREAAGPRPVTARVWSDPPEVREAALKARELYWNAMQGGDGSRDKLLMAQVYAEKAVQLAPGSAKALAILADIVHVLMLRGFAAADETMPRVRELRMKALAADDATGEIHISLGAMFLYWEDDFDMAGTELARGVELAPDDAEGHRIYGAWLRIAGRAQEALEHMRAAVRLAPKAPFMYVGQADVLMALGRYDEAIGPLRQALRLLPRYDAALERLEMSCHRAGRHDEALDARRMLLGIRGAGADRIARLTADAAEHGWLVARENDLRRELADLVARAEREDAFEDRHTTRQVADKVLVVLAELGEWSQAMDWVERAYHRRPGRLRRVLNDLPYDHHGLARDPRYARLLRAAGIEELLS